MAAFMTAFLAGPAYSQSMSLIPRPGDTHKTPEEIEQEKAIERDYNAANKKIPDKKPATDPWGNVRSAPAKPSAAKQQ